MACGITTSINRSCKNRQGGINKVYLFPFVKYSRSQIVTTGLVLDSFPSTVIYEFEVVPTASFDQKMNEEDAGKYYEQSITLQFLRIDTTILLQKFLKKDYRMIIEDNNGNLRMLGAYNGLTAESLDSTTGGGKSDFSGITISFTGKEKTEALFLDELLIPDIVVPEYLLLEDGTFILLEDANAPSNPLEQYIIL